MKSKSSDLKVSPSWTAVAQLSESIEGVSSEIGSLIERLGQLLENEAKLVAEYNTQHNQCVIQEMQKRQVFQCFYCEQAKSLAERQYILKLQRYEGEKCTLDECLAHADRFVEVCLGCDSCTKRVFSEASDVSLSVHSIKIVGFAFDESKKCWLVDIGKRKIDVEDNGLAASLRSNIIYSVENLVHSLGFEFLPISSVDHPDLKELTENPFDTDDDDSENEKDELAGSTKYPVWHD